MSNTIISPWRSDFPILTQKIRNKKLAYLDSAATSLKPWSVIERISRYYSYETANIHRGAHFLADAATQEFERSRDLVRDFIGAKEREEIIFTSGTTGSINLLADAWGSHFLKRGDSIVVTEMEHHGNLVPWQMLCQKVGAHLLVVNVDKDGQVDFSQLERLFSDRNSKVKLVAITHCSNTLGTYVDIKRVVNLAKSFEILVAVDGAQFVPTRSLNVQDLDVDFYSFSGHKLFGPYGVGILYGKRNLLQTIPPRDGGGSMISKVSFQGTTFNELPYKFEAGTPNISSVIALGSAIEYVQKIGFQAIEKHENSLLHEAAEKIRQIKGLKILADVPEKAPILSFYIEGLHHSDVSQIADQEGVALRAGHHCTMPLLEKFGVPGTIRASFSIYNDSQDINQLVLALQKAQEMLL